MALGLIDRTSLVVRCYLRSRCAWLDSLDDFPHGGGERFNLLLLLRDGRLEFGDCPLLFCDVPMLFQELIEQHRVEGEGYRAKTRGLRSIQI